MCDKFVVAALPDFQPPQSLVRHAELLGEGGDVHTEGRALLPQQRTGGNVGFAVGDGVEDFVGNVAFQAADDVAICQSFGSAAVELGFGARLVVAYAQQHDAVQRTVGLPVAAA